MSLYSLQFACNWSVYKRGVLMLLIFNVTVNIAALQFINCTYHSNAYTSFLVLIFKIFTYTAVQQLWPTQTSYSSKWYLFKNRSKVIDKSLKTLTFNVPLLLNVIYVNNLSKDHTLYCQTYWDGCFNLFHVHRCIKSST